jgi:hypothetical protein
MVSWPDFRRAIPAARRLATLLEPAQAGSPHLVSSGGAMAARRWIVAAYRITRAGVAGGRAKLRCAVLALRLVQAVDDEQDGSSSECAEAMPDDGFVESASARDPRSSLYAGGSASTTASQARCHRARRSRRAVGSPRPAACPTEQDRLPFPEPGSVRLRAELPKPPAFDRVRRHG